MTVLTQQPGELDELRGWLLDELRGRVGELRAEITSAIEVPYGDLPNQVLSLVWTEGLMRELFTHHRKVFGDALRAYATGERPGTPGRPPAGGR